MGCNPNHILIELGESRREEGRRIMARHKGDNDPGQDTIRRLRAVSAKLVTALRASAEKLHDLRGDRDCEAHTFPECPKYYCKDAREAIKEATE